MRTYRISELATGDRKGRVELGGIVDRLTAVKAYEAALQAMLRGMAQETRRSVLNELRRERSLEIKSAHGDWFRALDIVRSQLTAEASRLADQILTMESRRHTKRFMEDARRVLGIDLQGVILDEDLGEALDSAVSRNVGLIRSLGDDAMLKVQQVVHTASMNGIALREVATQLNNQFGIAKRRATLIAQDQISKWNSDLNRLRQTQAGVVKYKWRSSEDEKVRPLHAQLNGTEYAWNKPTGAEDGLPPGQPVRCRCIPIGIVEF